ncbi:MAG: S-layer protein [Candidatus Woesearchaeota archaeon]
MNMKKTIKRIVALGVGATMLGATITGALAASSLSEYPAPFVTNGVFSGKLVVGANAASSDVIGAIDIAASLQESATVDVPTDGTTGGTTLLGDAIEMSKSNDMLEMGEKIGSVRETLTEFDLDALHGGSITTDKGTTAYSQYLRFKNNEGAASASTLNSPRVVYSGNDAGNVEVGDWLFFKEGDDVTSITTGAFFEYELSFAEGLESEVQATTLNLKDFRNKNINIMGQEYVLVDPTISSTGYKVTLNLIGGDVVDTLREGETKTYTIDGQDYEVTAVFISDGDPNSVKFSVNSQLTDELEQGDTDILTGGLEIGVQSVLTNNRDGIVEFFLGANKITLIDDNVSDDLFDTSSAVSISKENIENAAVKIKGAFTDGTVFGATVDGGETFEITDIKYRLLAEPRTDLSSLDIYVPPGHGVREYLKEPQGMLNPNWDIRYEGLLDTTSTPIIIDGSSDQYRLTVTNLRNQVYKFDLYGVSTSGAGTLKTSKKSDTERALLWEEADASSISANDWLQDAGADVTNTSTIANVNRRDYFLVSDQDSSVDKNANSHVLRYDSIDTSNKQIQFTDLAAGTITSTYGDAPAAIDNPYVIGTGTIDVDGNSFQYYVMDATSLPTAHPLVIDFDGNGTVDGGHATFTVKGGGVLDFGNGAMPYDRSATAASVVMNLTTDDSLFDTTGTDEYINWSVTAISGDVGLSTLGSNRAVTIDATDGTFTTSVTESPDDNDEHDFGATRYGVLIDLYNPTGTNNPEELTFDYPTAQRGAQVFVTAGSVESTSTGGSGGAKRINPISIGLAVLDKDAPAVGSTPLLVVGGPCANTVAAELMGNPADCLAGFETGKAMIKLYPAKNAMLVAGRDAMDTLGAAYVLADYASYDLTGTEVEIVVTSLDDLRVNPVQ